MTALPEPPGPQDPPPAPAPAPRRPRSVLAIVLGIALVLALAAIGVLLYLFLDAQRRLGEQIDDLEQRIEEQDRTIEQQQQRVDEKETFGVSMRALMATAESLEGTVVGGIVPIADYQAIATTAWERRWSGDGLRVAIQQADEARAALEERIAAAQAERGQNASGTVFEATIDELSGGFARIVLDDAAAVCGRPAFGCVSSEEPTLVHFDAASDAQPYMTDWLRTGVSYHEFAHVLQFTHPESSDALLTASFGGDYELMADCFALTFLPGWTLDHRIWVSGSEYWDVSIGYGVACDAGQQQALRDWYAGLPLTVEPISQ